MTADIGFKPYSATKLAVFAEQLQVEGLLVRVIVRPSPLCQHYEILAGHNRVKAARLAGWATIPAEVVEADDERAIVIATSTNLIQRQGLTIIERGKTYKALLDAKNRNGQRNAALETFGDNRQSYNARKLVAEFFGVTEYEIRKAVKLVFAAWREARDAAEKRLTAPPRKISFDRKQFAPYLDQFSNDREIEKLFLEFLQERAKVS